MPPRAPHRGEFRRRDLIKLRTTAVPAAVLGRHIARGRALAQTPKRGGVITIRAWDPPHFDPHLTISDKTHIAYSFTHSRLLKYKAGPSVPSPIHVSVWDGALRNYAPNFGYDYGGRLMAAGLDR